MKLPFFLSKCDLPENDVSALYAKLNDFIKYLSKQSYFAGDAYSQATKEYVEAYSYIINKMNQGNQGTETAEAGNINNNVEGANTSGAQGAGGNHDSMNGDIQGGEIGGTGNDAVPLPLPTETEAPAPIAV